MEATTATPNAYLRTKVMTAGPGELRLMLLDGAIKFAEQGRKGIEEKDHETVYNGLTRCQNIVMELINSLKHDEDPELCERISGLYTFIYLQLVKGATERDIDAVAEAVKLLQYERETWAMALEQMAQDNANAAGMSNVPDARPANSAGAPPSGLIGGKISLEG